MNLWITGHVRTLTGRGFAATTIADRIEVLQRLDRDLPMGLIQATVEELEDWLARPGWSNQTKATYYGHIVGFYNWAADPAREQHLSYNPAASLSRASVPPTVPRPVSDEELALVLDKAQGRWKLYCLLAAYAGLRCCEIATIRREDFTRTHITVTGKGGKQAIIRNHAVIWRAVEHLPAGPVARKARGPADAMYVSSQTSKYLNRILGPNAITLHRLRHWYATNLLRAGANLRVVQEQMRHSSPKTTAIYTDVTDGERAIAVNALPDFTAPPTSS